MVLKSLQGLALLAVFWLSIGSAACVRRPAEMLIPACPTPNPETIKSLTSDDVPLAIVDYLIDIDIYCDAVDAIIE